MDLDLLEAAAGSLGGPGPRRGGPGHGGPGRLAARARARGVTSEIGAARTPLQLERVATILLGLVGGFIVGMTSVGSGSLMAPGRGGARSA